MAPSTMTTEDIY